MELFLQQAMEAIYESAPDHYGFPEAKNKSSSELWENFQNYLAKNSDVEETFNRFATHAKAALRGLKDEGVVATSQKLVKMFESGEVFRAMTDFDAGLTLFLCQMTLFSQLLLLFCSINFALPLAPLTSAPAVQVLKKDVHVYDGSLGGNSALALAYYMRVLAIRHCTIYVPIDVAFDKIAKVSQMGVKVVRVDSSRLQSHPREAAKIDPFGFYLNSIGNLAYSEQFFRDPTGFRHKSINLFDETMHQLRDEENITSIDYFIAPIGTGQLVSSIGNGARRWPVHTEIVAVDSQHSLYYDYAVHGSFEDESGAAHWHLPSIPEMGNALLGPLKYGNNTRSVKLFYLSTIVDVRLPDDNEIYQIMLYFIQLVLLLLLFVIRKFSFRSYEVLKRI
ncbi:hypothetical protein WR25_17624 isoform B [Diploscapter pachys]|uniref:Tryptophan synthase beta chain-like PALP domain-containing protein n=1 Tax=Diploscapter pachys TaxID=2018661 RepID=A0A2A2J5M2_9BILA|nr:hypothetical protein WR25_17624 isoform B [Diploscapter pachys]